MSGPKWDDGTVVMNWTEEEDPANPGMWIAAYCAAEYNRSDSYSRQVQLQFFYGPNTIDALGDDISISDILPDQALPEDHPQGVWMYDEANESTFYASSYERRESS